MRADLRVVEIRCNPHEQILAHASDVCDVEARTRLFDAFSREVTLVGQPGATLSNIPKGLAAAPPDLWLHIAANHSYPIAQPLPSAPETTREAAECDPQRHYLTSPSSMWCQIERSSARPADPTNATRRKSALTGRPFKLEPDAEDGTGATRSRATDALLSPADIAAPHLGVQCAELSIHANATRPRSSTQRLRTRHPRPIKCWHAACSYPFNGTRQSRHSSFHARARTKQQESRSHAGTCAEHRHYHHRGENRNHAST